MGTKISNLNFFFFFLLKYGFWRRRSSSEGANPSEATLKILKREKNGNR